MDGVYNGIDLPANNAGRQRKKLFRSFLFTSVSLSAALTASAARADCSNTAPVTGTSVACTGASTTGVIAAGSDQVTLDLATGGSIVPTSGPSIWLGKQAHVHLEANTTTGNPALANTSALLLGDGATVVVDGLIESQGGITGPTQGGNATGLAGATITVSQTGAITTNGTANNRAIDGRAGGNSYVIDGTISATGTSGQGISVGNGDVLTLGATGSIGTLSGDTSNPIDGFGKTGVTVTTAAGSSITLHGIGRAIQLGANANVTIGGAIVSLGDNAITNSSGGVAVEVGINSTVHLLSTGSITTGNTSALGNGGSGGTGISTYSTAGTSHSTIIVDGTISTQKATGILAGVGDTITIGATGKVTTRGSSRGIFVNAYSATDNNVVNIDIAGRVEQLGTSNALYLSGSRATGQTVETAVIANVTIEQGGSLFSQSNTAYGQDNGAGNFPEVIDNLVVAGTVQRGTAGVAIDLNDGADTITLLPTAVIGGSINGGSDAAGLPEIDTFALDGASGTSGTFDFGVNAITNFEAGKKLGGGTWTLKGAAGTGLNGVFAVNAGTLLVDGSLGSASVTVASGGALGGAGSIGNAVTIADGATLIGREGQTLTTGALSLSGGSIVSATLGAPGGAGLFNVQGNLTLDGTLNVTSAGGFGAGVYRLFDYGGALTDNGLAIGSVPMGTNVADLTVQTSVANQVNVVVADGPGPIQFWNGAATTPTGAIVGGSGIWSAGPTTNWTNAAGARSDRWLGNFAVFQGGRSAANGTVTIDNSQGAVSAKGVQFIGTGWTVAGDALTLAGDGGSTTIRVGDGSAAGAGDSVTISAPLTGATRLVKDDLGTLILTGASNYSGGTTINAGTLQLGNGGTTGTVTGDIVDNGTLAFSRSDAVTFAAAISGTGLVRQIGGNMLTFSGDSSAFAGETRVEAGTLSVGGRLGGLLTVASGGRLQGIGTVGTVAVASGATIAPGNSIGTLNTGAITFGAGSIYEVEVDAAGNGDRIASSGVATINGGTVRVLAGAGNYARGTSYTILTATGGVTGSGFAGVTSNLAFLTPTLAQGANSVILTLTRNDIDFAAIGGSFNERSSGHALDAIGGGAIYNAVVQLDAPTARAAFDALSGEVHPSIRTAMIEDSRLPREAVLRALSGDGPDGVHSWAQGFGNWGHSDGDGNAAGIDRDTGGFIIGVDTALGANWRLGVAGGYTRTDLRIPTRASAANADQVHVLAYAGAAYGPVRIRIGGGYAHAALGTVRSAGFPGFSDSLSARYDGSVVQGFGELAYRLNAGHGSIEPFAGLNAANARTDGFTEHGGAAALAGDRANETIVQSAAGLRAATAPTAPVSFNALVAWKHNYGDLTPLSALRFAGHDPFLIAGTPLARDSAAVDLGLTWHLTARLSLAATYSGVFGDGVRDHAAKGGLQLNF